jgi:membrane-associated phospholipid phosphatase
MRCSRNAGCWAFAAALCVAGAGLGSSAAAASTSDRDDRPYWRTNLFKRVFADQKFLVTRWWPQELKEPWFAGTLGASATVMIVSATDTNGGWEVSLENGIAAGASPGAKSAAHVFTTIGNGPAAAAILGIAYLSARRAHDDRFAEASSLAVESLADAGIWIVVLKSVAARVRPGNPDPNRFFHYGVPDNNSFPSGHAMGAFSLASVFAELYRDKTWVPWVSYGTATLIGASRLVLGRHFPSDVIIGAVLGTSIGRGVVARGGHEIPRMRGSIGPVLGPEGRGVGVGWSTSW